MGSDAVMLTLPLAGAEKRTYDGDNTRDLSTALNANASAACDRVIPGNGRRKERAEWSSLRLHFLAAFPHFLSASPCGKRSDRL
jgi:hypothetical protein